MHIRRVRYFRPPTQICCATRISMILKSRCFLSPTISSTSLPPTTACKHLSWGFFKNSLTFAPFADTPAIYTIYESLLSHAAYTYRSPELMFYMILELVSGTSYNAILYQQPVPLEELKPELYAAIRGIFKQFRIRKKRKTTENAGANPDSLLS